MVGEFKLSDAVPWGRSAEEYEAFFDLGDLSPQGRVLDCAGGPSSFNAEWSAAGRSVISVDPIYRYSAAAIEGRIAEARRLMMDGLRAAEARFSWGFHGSLAGLEAARLAAMRHFLDDFGQGGGRYLAAALPVLPLRDRAFDLVLCSHFLFTYSARFDFAFHLAAVREMARVGHEVRVFPLLDLEGRRSCHVDGLLRALRSEGRVARVRDVAYEFQLGGSQMLQVAASR